MSRRTQLKTFVPRRDSDPETTVRKTVWNPSTQKNQSIQDSLPSLNNLPSLNSLNSLNSVQILFSKVTQVEGRLDHLETLINQNTDPDLKRREQEEVDQSRHELADMHKQLEEAVLRLQQREDDLQDTKTALDNLSNQAAADRQKIQDLEKEKKVLHQLIQDLETKLNERVKRVGHLEKEITNMQRALHNTNNRLEVMQLTMEKMQKQMTDFSKAQSCPQGATPAPTTTASATAQSHQRASRAAPPSQSPATASSTTVHVGSEESSSSQQQQQNGGAAGRGTAATTPRLVTGNVLGLPPIALPTSQMGGGGVGGRASARGDGGGKNVMYNFPPK